MPALLLARAVVGEIPLALADERAMCSVAEIDLDQLPVLQRPDADPHEQVRLEHHPARRAGRRGIRASRRARFGAGPGRAAPPRSASWSLTTSSVMASVWRRGGLPACRAAATCSLSRQQPAASRPDPVDQAGAAASDAAHPPGQPVDDPPAPPGARLLAWPPRPWNQLESWSSRAFWLSVVLSPA